MKKKDTIFALASGSGKAAISIIRISGPESIKTINSLSLKKIKKPREARLTKLFSSSGELIDQTITTIFKKPQSYTGEDMVEISAHGGNAVLKKLFEELRTKPMLRLARPGEFTKRAFENNKLELTQVEAIADIVNSETEMQRKQAISHLSGFFFIKSKKIFNSLKKTLANIEAVIDFADDELPKNLYKKIKEQIENNIKETNSLISTANIGKSIRGGFLVVILGKPNTGKSSFINYISGKDISIVTNIPGTTRDLLESFLDINGLPIRFVDTAGIRSNDKKLSKLNKVEKIGIELAVKAADEADLNLVFIEKKSDIRLFKNFKNTVFIKSKQDLKKSKFIGDNFYNISSKTGFGIDGLLKIINKKIAPKTMKEEGYISRERHLKCIEKVNVQLKKAKNDKNIDLIAEDIRISIKELGNLFGNVDIEDILDIIFSDFCIGK